MSRGKYKRNKNIKYGHTGIKHSDTAKKKISEAMKGSKNPKWKGGITALLPQMRNTMKYKQWRSDIYQRDNWTCQTCGKLSEGDLEVHHIKTISNIFKEYQLKSIDDILNCEELWDRNNGITLCKECHNLTKKRKIQF